MHHCRTWTSRATLALCLTALAAPGCGSDPDPTSDTDAGMTGTTDGGSGGGDDGGTGGEDGGGTGGEDGGTTGEDGGTVPLSEWALRSHLCVGNRTDALHRDADGTLYVGCGSTTVGLGIYVSRDDGATWQRPTTTPGGFFDTWRVLDVSRSADGLLYVAGTDTASSRRVVSADTSGASWSLDEVYNAGSVVGSSFIVGNFRRDSTGRAVAESLNGVDVQARASDDAPWVDVSEWGDEYGGLQILDLEVHEDRFFATGSTISQPPYLFLPRSAPGFGFRVVNLAGTGIGAYRGEMWGVAVDGSGLVVAGVNQDRDVGMIYALASADSTEVQTFDLSTFYPDEATWIRGVCRSGEILLAVGERTAESRGIVLRSDDNGGTWRDVTPEPTTLPPVHRCVMVGGDRAFVAGADGAFLEWNRR